MCRLGILVLMVLVIITNIVADDSNAEVSDPPQERDIQEFLPHNSDEEYIRHVHSMMNAYRSDMLGDRLVIETNALIDTKYRTWKRNADLINSLLALPKGMNDAGR